MPQTHVHTVKFRLISIRLFVSAFPWHIYPGIWGSAVMYLFSCLTELSAEQRIVFCVLADIEEPLSFYW